MVEIIHWGTCTHGFPRLHRSGFRQPDHPGGHRRARRDPVLLPPADRPLRAHGPPTGREPTTEPPRHRRPTSPPDSSSHRRARAGDAERRPRRDARPGLVPRPVRLRLLARRRPLPPDQRLVRRPLGRPRRVRPARRRSRRAASSSATSRRPLDAAADPTIAHAVIRPERVPTISYPYEWSFGMLKDAALADARRAGRSPPSAASRSATRPPTTSSSCAAGRSSSTRSRSSAPSPARRGSPTASSASTSSRRSR